MRSQSLALVALLLAAAGCEKERSLEPLGEVRGPTYAQARTVLEARCGSCHSGPTAAGGFGVETYARLVERRPDGSQRVVPADENSQLLLAARNQLPGHPAVEVPEEERRTLEQFVATRMAPSAYQIHENGWMNPGDREQFHGAVLRSAAYRLDSCTDCHGADLAGGGTGIGCQQCHTRGVLSCDTCHGDPTSPAPPASLDGITSTASVEVGAHRAHLEDGPLHEGYGCADCHPAFQGVEGEGHYRRGGALDPPPAELSFNSTAGQTGRFDRQAATCSNVYCHRPRVDDSAARNQAPAWTDLASGQAACGTCHGMPPAAPHPQDARCQVCHQLVVANGFNVALHTDGQIALGRTDSRGCRDCHGDSTSSAPPTDLLGDTDRSAPGVGAHRVHLEAPGNLSNPVACAECHLVPAEVTSAGHLDAPGAEVFPAGSGTIANAQGTQSSYDSAARTCATWCHGAPAQFTDDPTAGINRAPVWTGDAAQVACGTGCHGNPPADPTHVSVSAQPGECQNCHSLTFEAGAIRFTTDPVSGARTTTHVNGRVDFR